MKVANNKVRMTFPMRLHLLLSQAEFLGVEHIISWNSSGTQFTIYNQKEFVAKILPNMYKQSSFASFRRQLNAYGFKREFDTKNIFLNAQAFVYSHEFFRRDDPVACEYFCRRYSKNYVLMRELIANLDRPQKQGYEPSIVKSQIDIKSSHDCGKSNAESKPADDVLSSDSHSHHAVESDIILDELVSCVLDKNDISSNDYALSTMISSWDPLVEDL